MFKYILSDECADIDVEVDNIYIHKRNTGDPLNPDCFFKVIKKDTSGFSYISIDGFRREREYQYAFHLEHGLATVNNMYVQIKMIDEWQCVNCPNVFSDQIDYLCPQCR